MLKTKRGNVLDSDCTVICHVMNCEEKLTSKMGELLHKRYPEVERIDWSYEKRGRERLGNISFGLSNDYKKLIFNLYAQNKVGDKIDYDCFEKSFESMLILVDRMEGKGFYVDIGVAHEIGSMGDDGNGDTTRIQTIMQKLSERYGRTINLFRDTFI